jgi:osmotically-inducible protein OsmY
MAATHRSEVMRASSATLLTLWLAACSSQPPRTPQEHAQDAQLAQQVEAALDADPRIYARHVDVTSNRGVITLSGLIWSNEDYLLAKRDAELVPGVVRVDASMDLVRGGLSGTSR